MMPRQPMGEGETQVTVTPGRDYLDGQPSTTDASLSRLQLGDRQVPPTCRVVNRLPV